MTPVLVLVDLQADFLASPALRPAVGELVARTQELLAGFRGAGLPVVHVWTTVHLDPDDRMPHWRRRDDRRCLAGTPGHSPPPPLHPLAEETIVHKTAYTAFEGGALEVALERLGARGLVLAGVHLHGCVRATAIDAYQRGFEVWVASDATGSDDPLHADLTRRYLASRVAVLEPVGDLLRRHCGRSIPARPVHQRLPVARLGARSIEATSEPSIVLVSPRRTEEGVASVPIAAGETVAAATEAAASAAADWRARTAAERVAPLKALARRLESERVELARRLAVEIGKPVAYGRTEIDFAVRLLGLTCEEAHEESERGGDGRVRRPPHGVVALITPWNNPISVPLGKLAPALAWGNTVVWKPALEGTLRAFVMAGWLAEAGLPEGALGIVSGDASTGEHLMAEARVDAISLTGSEAAGLTARAVAAARGVPLQAELGGNNAAIVWSDADLGAAAAAVAEGAFGAAGQRCTATRRVIVESTCYDHFRSLVEEAVAQLGWGDPLDETTIVGPLVSESARTRLEEVVDRARAAGCAVTVPHLSGARAAAPEGGCYLPPTLIESPGPAHEIVQEESFGPVLVMQRAPGWSQALELLNGVRQGLVAALFSPSQERRESFLAEAQAGVLKVDRATAGVSAELPFGGWKASGVGAPEHGGFDRAAFTRVQAVEREDGTKG